MDTYSQWRFPHEHLRVYQDACQFLQRVHGLSTRGHRDLHRQLSRAALSVSLNVCEGRSQRFAGNSGVNFYRIALGSAAECHGALQALEIITGTPLDAEIALIRRVGARLAGLLNATGTS